MNDCVSCVVLVGVEPRPRRVEVFVGGDGPSFHLVDLPDAAVGKAKERVRAAIQSPEFTFPGRRVVLKPDGSLLILERHIVETITYRGQL
jgi:hypothetical protein